MPMIPVARPDDIDVSVEASPLLEMLLSLESLSMPRCPQEISGKAEEILGPDFRQTVTNLYGALAHGTMFMEFTLAWDDHEDVPGFLEWIAGMDDREFTWYILGRITPIDRLPDRLTSRSLSTLLKQESHNAPHAEKWYINFDWTEDIGGFRKRLLTLWKQYWTGVFRNEVDSLRPRWNAGIREKQDEIEQFGYRESYTNCVGTHELPDPLPPDVPYANLSFVPSCRTPHGRPITFFGYGSIKIIYNCVLQEEDRERIRRLREQLVAGFKSLSDETRLGVFKLIALNEKVVNGKWLSARLKISPSVVSRHLRQLKESGFIEEFSEDNRSITYAVKWDNVRGVFEQLESYLLETMMDKEPSA